MTPQLDKAVDLKTQSDFYSFEVNESIATVLRWHRNNLSIVFSIT